MSLSVLLRMLDNQHVKEADTILMYYSLPDEVFTHEVINTLVEEGKTVLLPVVLNGEDMELRLYRGAEDLKTGSFGIMEPVGKPFPCYSEIDVAIIPGMSFDNVVKTTVFLADMADFADMNEVYAQFFAAPFPARSAVAVKTLPKGARVEIECIAVR